MLLQKIVQRVVVSLVNREVVKQATLLWLNQIHKDDSNQKPCTDSRLTKTNEDLTQGNKDKKKGVLSTQLKHNAILSKNIISH